MQVISLSSPIEKKIAWAEQCYQNSGKYLLDNDVLKRLLADLKQAIDVTHREMDRSGVARLCMACDLNEGGSCCGAGLEDRYDGRLLLINLLLGVELPEKRRDPSSCYFLGEAGCLLKARHVICVNYICRKITVRLDPVKIGFLKEKEGEELTTLFLLNEQMRKKMTILQEIGLPDQ